MDDILVIRFSSLGDVVMASAVPEFFSRYHPEKRLHFLTKEQYAPVFENDNRISSVTGICDKDSPSKIADMLGKKSFCAIIDLHSNLRSISISFLLKSSLKISVKKSSAARRLMVLSRGLFRKKFDTLGNYLDTLRPFGIKERIFPRIIVDYAASAGFKNIFGDISGLPSENINMVIISPGAKHAAKRWPENYFAQTADTIYDRGYFPLFIGDTHDIPVIERIIGKMHNKGISLAGKINLQETIAAISASEFVITNDSGPMHIAGALKKPFTAIFGPTHPDLGFSPGYENGNIIHSGIKCSPCSIHGEKPCRMPRQFCMEDITPEFVLKTLPV